MGHSAEQTNMSVNDKRKRVVLTPSPTYTNKRKPDKSQRCHIVIKPGPQVRTKCAVYIKGEKVLADWEGTWYQAVILRVNKTKGYYIKYLVDKVRTTVQADRLKKVS